ncbi:isocitrate/isopropylmalate family dehydrogenase [Methanobacterium formicicum]|jgi:3-isopropylmalate dehydrogenase|uniref:3-isopropylmalate dehydrogenase n=2 Tax=Methanobacterium TaxID=2160 RepID=A0A090I345_METFO|nr:isocitrate/isopropylmalate family dehydrogenase [Methanobacterium formicicum]MBF4475075.1 NAD-dependent isocitrate dehydrogenase [Methanobacterium formicicum]MDH2660143.1 isocitrate/isopropylmalate family dehydrogenase [Methanobacterium formicicum]CEA13563.1 3-isopropylmalate dehydrogenase [Methanobacterium formicicum]
MYKIAVIPGDGIGKEVMEATLHVLEAIDVEFDYTFADAGDEYMEKTGVPLPQETVDIVKSSQACLFGAAGESAADVIVKMRQELDLYVNLRPVKSYPGTKSLFDNLDFVIVRENTEGLYIGLEEETEEGATALRVTTRKAAEKICKYAFEYAKKTGRKKVTAVHKANVLKKTDGLFKETFYKVAEDYPDMELDDRYVDATAMFFITKPDMFDVIVTTNLFGDILSDEGAGLVGGLGLIPSANIGDKQGLFEPVHGSAPRIAGQGIANPSAMILSAVLMLDYLEENEAARKLENALVDVLAEGNVVTVDLGGSASTMEMAAEIRSKLEK